MTPVPPVPRPKFTRALIHPRREDVVGSTIARKLQSENRQNLIDDAIPRSSILNGEEVESIMANIILLDGGHRHSRAKSCSMG